MASSSSVDTAKFAHTLRFIPRRNKSRPWTAATKGQVISASRLHAVYYYLRIGTWRRSNSIAHIRGFIPVVKKSTQNEIWIIQTREIQIIELLKTDITFGIVAIFSIFIIKCDVWIFDLNLNVGFVKFRGNSSSVNFARYYSFYNFI